MTIWQCLRQRTLVLSLCFLTGLLTARANAFDQWADRVLAVSSQYTINAWGAIQATGPANVGGFGDNSSAWAPSNQNGTTEFLSLGFGIPVYATDITIYESFGNGFVTKVEMIDTEGALHTVWSGVDPTEPGEVAPFHISFPKTAYRVIGAKITVDTERDPNRWEEIDAVQLSGVERDYGLWASKVLDFSSQYSGTVWSAAQALGSPDTPYYGDHTTAWAPLHANGTEEFLTLDFGSPVYATAVGVRETLGNGFVKRIELLDSQMQPHLIWSGIDTTPVGGAATLFVEFPQTAYLVKAVKITIDTNHDPYWEEIDSVRLYGSQPTGLIGSIDLVGAVDMSQPLDFTFRPSNGAPFMRTVTPFADGSFLLGDLPTGNYDIAIKGSKWLQSVVKGVAFTSGGTIGIVATLLPGDLNGDNVIELDDLVLFFDAYGSVDGDANWNPDADLSCDGQVELDDLTLFFDDYGKEGDP